MKKIFALALALVTVITFLPAGPALGQTSGPDVSGVLPSGSVDIRRPTLIRVDALGHVVQKEAIPVGATYVRDPAGRLTEVRQGEGAETRKTRYTYNTDGLIESITDPLGKATWFVYNVDDQVTQQTRPDGQNIVYVYAGTHRTAVIPPGRPAHSFLYNEQGLLLQYEAPYVGNKAPTRTTYTYDAENRLIARQGPDGSKVGFSYDGQRRLVETRLDRGSITYRYDTTTGKLVSTSAFNLVSQSFQYNGDLLATITWAGPVAGQLAFSYDPTQKHISRVRVNDQELVSFSFDGAGQLIKAGDLSLTRDAQRPELIVAASLGGLTERWTYNQFGEVIEREARHKGTQLYRATYSRDALGRVLSKVEIANGASDSVNFRYDDLGRLIEAISQKHGANRYSYDLNGNRLTGPTSTVQGRYDAQDRLTAYDDASYAYSAAGVLQSKTTAGGATKYQYDELGNLLEVTVPSGQKLSYLTDSSNRRIGKLIDGKLTKAFLYQDNLRITAELDGSGRVVSRFVYGDQPNVPEYMVRAGVNYRIITNQLGSPVLVVDTATGRVAQQIEYDEFGQILVDTSPGFQPFGFAGGLYDPDTGLVRFGVRDYDPHSGRWTTRDPLGFQGGDTNLYAYVLNDPVNYTDPTGFSFWSVLLRASANLGKDAVATAIGCIVERNFNLRCFAKGMLLTVLVNAATEFLFPARSEPTPITSSPAPAASQSRPASPPATSSPPATAAPQPPSAPAMSYRYGVLGQGVAQTTEASPGVCALYFYPMGGTEKTFIFRLTQPVRVQNYNGTLACWQTEPTWYDVNGRGPNPSHPYAALGEVFAAGIAFSGSVEPFDPTHLRK